MAGEWIKLENVTPDKPEVFIIAEHLGIDPDAVIGKLCRLWIWADEQTVDGNANRNATRNADSNADRNALSVTRALVDRISGVTGFTDAMLKAGWLRQTEIGFEFPNFYYHNGLTAKQRALTAKRQRTFRAARNADSNANRNATRNAPSVTSALPREEKRREDNKDKKDTFATPLRGAADVPVENATECDVLPQDCKNPQPAADRATSNATGEKNGHPVAKPPAKKQRERNPLFDAIAEVCGEDPDLVGAKIGKVAAALAKASPPYTPHDVRRFAAEFGRHCPWAIRDGRTRPTSTELQSHIGKLRAAPAPATATILPAPVVQRDDRTYREKDSDNADLVLWQAAGGTPAQFHALKRQQRDPWAELDAGRVQLEGNQPLALEGGAQ